MWKRITAGLLLIFLCGCLKTKDEVTINADGSGKVHLESRSSLPPEMAESMGGAGQIAGMGATVYPPISEAEARKFFPEKNFKLTVKQERADNGDITTLVDAEFKDINALLASPYGRAHQLSAQIQDGSLIVRGISGMEAAARYAEMKDDSGMGTMSGVADLQKKKNEMSADFRITLPNSITSGNGTNQGKTEIWAAQRAQCKDAEDFAQKLSTVCEVRCSTEGLKFSPIVPVRLSLQRFAELPAGAAQTKGAGIDTNEISAAVKFVPYGLSITRSLDLSGEGGPQQNQAQLIGAIVVPAEFVPQKWGKVTLDEAVDSKGNDLKPANSAEDRFTSMTFGYGVRDNEQNEGDASTNPPALQRHVVSLAFRPPDWKVNEIARIKGSAVLQYFGGSQTVVKLTNAVPANWIMDVSRMMGGSFDSSEKNFRSDALNALGLSISAAMCMSQSGMTVLTLQVKGKNAALADAQVFDADGRPWPTMLTQMDIGEAGTCQVMIAGKPKPPLSLALLASGGGSTVEVPILLEHVAVTQKQ
jgi:hypothetical protein